MVDVKLISFVARAKRRKETLEILSKHPQLSQSEIMRGLKQYKSHNSTTIKELTETPEKIKDFFQRKTEFIKEIMQNLDPEKKHFDQDLFEKMDLLVTIRNLYAHVPQEYLSGDFRFNGGDHYYNKKTMHLKGKPIKELNTDFVNLCLLMQQKLGECFILIGKEVKNQKYQTD